ncbi:23S rRNA (uracil(1939)-C(5))-methyltransferase RlmD [Bacillaceae bacterium SIJ1]|uniref:23S rRNA (uracil(1939)-C(5))-methyltransferase RlmD n=1 Tax=Litoribacterium kuwaitense TaxID=1398745 RepID=UPI0013EDF31D|nr:23S rRNA (uracil(1939)-C(5))-methyltransferase RlmD [Litoribacterium kuwaitense]NGP46091.1 23S rRNA (uracil(1939)-C(5))-methyltransferase RlmD [Litoribacterium kuwaitense]
MAQSKQIPVEKNKYYRTTVEDLTHEGAGVAKVDGFPVFVPKALPAEDITLKIVKVKKNFAFGRLVETHQASSDRVEAPCPVFGECGGCQLQHLSYEGQLAYKQRQVTETLKRLGGLEDVVVHPTIGMEDPWSYRNKVQTPVGERNSSLIAGFYKQRSHELVDLDVCMIQNEANDDVVQGVRAIAETYGIRAYDEKTHKGTLRHILVRNAKTTGEQMVTLVTKNATLPNKANIIRDIREQYPSVVSIVQNVNPKRTNVILGAETNVLWGKETIRDEIDGVSFDISSLSFYQVNPVQTEKLYEKALKYASLTGEETVIDAYCGIGTISLFLARKAKHVYGVEIVPEAIEDAKKNAVLNDIDNATFAAGKAEDVMPTWQKQGIHADVIVVDPPRKGCDDALLQTMLTMKPNRIVYVSCNPATLARDLATLTNSGAYEVKEVQPVDMFPQTTHVECCALLVLK